MKTSFYLHFFPSSLQHGPAGLVLLCFSSCLLSIPLRSQSPSCASRSLLLGQLLDMHCPHSSLRRHLSDCPFIPVDSLQMCPVLRWCGLNRETQTDQASWKTTWPVEYRRPSFALSPRRPCADEHCGCLELDSLGTCPLPTCPLYLFAVPTSQASQLHLALP